jgi:hypothetical protein
MAKHKYIQTPEILWKHFEAYKEDIKSRPFMVKDWVGKDGDQVYREKERPLTIEGFEMYCFENKIINDLSNYFANSNNKYSEFSTICSRIKQSIRQDQIEGGMAGMYNPSITQRLNGLTDKTEQAIEVKSFDVSLKL